MRKLTERDIDAAIKAKRPLLDLLLESGALIHTTPKPPPCCWPRWSLRVVRRVVVRQ